MKLHKIITLSASVLMLMSAGASFNSLNNTHVHASQISNLKAERSRDYSDIKRINAQLNKLKHKRINSKKHHAKRTHVRYFSSKWFARNRRKIENKYDNGNGTDYPSNDHSPIAMYAAGEDVEGGEYPAIDANSCNNKYYKMGWIMNYTVDDHRVKDYARAIRFYNSGVKQLKKHHANAKQYVSYGDNNKWDIQTGD